MEPPPPTFFSGRRRSSVGLLLPPPSQSHVVAARKASTWDSTDAPLSSGNSTSASHISARRASENPPEGPPPENFAAGSITVRKASNWDDPTVNYGGVSASDIAGRRATEMDQPLWDRFCGPPPSRDGSTWDWMTQIDAMITSTIPFHNITFIERNRIFYNGNLNYIFDKFNGQILEIENLEAVTKAYGVENEGIKEIIQKNNGGIFSINWENKEILLTQNISISAPNDPLITLRHASKCFEGKLLSPIHFAGYIFDVILTSFTCLGGKPPFMLLGMYGILGTLKGSNNNALLTTTDVKSFISLWKILKPEETEELTLHISENFNGSISCYGFYNLLYRRNAFGKQRIQAFDTKMGPKDPPLCLFTLIDKDKDGFLLYNDLYIFSAVFGRNFSNEVMIRVTREFDFDGDGKIGFDDFRRSVTPVLDGITWEFWLVAVVLALKI